MAVYRQPPLFVSGILETLAVVVILAISLLNGNAAVFTAGPLGCLGSARWLGGRVVSVLDSGAEDA